MPRETRTYTEEQKSEALRLWDSVGAREAGRRTGIPFQTIASWARRSQREHEVPPNAQREMALELLRSRNAEIRERLRLGMLEKALQLLARMDEPHVEFKGNNAGKVTYPVAPAGAVRDYAVSIGVLIDKYRLEVGESTTRDEHVTVTAGMDDHERQTLARILDEAIAEHETSDVGA